MQLIREHNNAMEEDAAEIRRLKRDAKSREN
jgi:hypothetical protein